ncbi:hypothetical protein AFLA70_234g001661 [Aspergillus flavus AF70]|nr:hypothetical protein AFLA70_234g001661 [Aspergillus flavus AF70]
MPVWLHQISLLMRHICPFSRFESDSVASRHRKRHLLLGYGLDNENIRLLRLRSFTIGRPLADEELMSPNAQDKIAALIGIMEPFVTYLNSVVMPDPEDMDASSGSESTD